MQENTNRTVIEIPASVNFCGQKLSEKRILRVASYSRVSTDYEEQLSSFETQKSYYQDLILRTAGWKLAGTYADEGISGASATRRPEFMKMIRHCKAGKIDLIITKAVSRFARNTLDSISYVRKLKAMGVGVYFEKENLNTLTESSEVILTIMASLAQEELNSLSKNVKMGKRMAMKEGKFKFVQLYGYRKGEDGEPVIVEAEAEDVREIFRQYIDGKCAAGIAKELNSKSRQQEGKRQKHWSTSNVRAVLDNEKYCGDVILQKTYVSDPITKKIRKNNGELPKVYIRNNHPGIVDRETFEQAQNEIARRNGKKKISKRSRTEHSNYSDAYALSERLFCGKCHSPYRRTVWIKRDGTKQPVWRCVKRLDYGQKYCSDSVSVDEAALHKAIMAAIIKKVGGQAKLVPMVTRELKKVISQKGMEEKEDTFDYVSAEEKIKELKEATMKLIEDSIKNGTFPDELKLKKLSNEARRLSDKVDEYKLQKENAKVETRMQKIEELLTAKDCCTEEYDDDLVRQAISNITVISESEIHIIFADGSESSQEMEGKIRTLKKRA